MQAPWDLPDFLKGSPSARVGQIIISLGANPTARNDLKQFFIWCAVFLCDVESVIELYMYKAAPAAILCTGQKKNLQTTVGAKNKSCLGNLLLLLLTETFRLGV